MLRCTRCTRILLCAAAMPPAVDTGPMPHPAGALGRTCAVKAGLLQASLFSRRRQARTVRPRRDVGQMEIAA